MSQQEILILIYLKKILIWHKESMNIYNAILHWFLYLKFQSTNELTLCTYEFNPCFYSFHAVALFYILPIQFCTTQL